MIWVVLVGGFLSLAWPWLAFHGTEANPPYHWTWTLAAKVGEGAWLGFLFILGLVWMVVWTRRHPL